MYCPQCDCEYQGWNQKCPVCRTVLQETKSKIHPPDSDPIAYNELIDAVRQGGGSLTIQMVATDVETKRGRGFPYIGRGYAWAKNFEGELGNLTATLATTEVGRDRKRVFPYFGYGFAWEKEMQGLVDGNPITLKAEKVARQSQMGFPYAGYGRAWVQAMSGTCGDVLKAELRITEVRKRKQYGFPYFGFGFAWANAGELTLTLLD